MRLRAALDRRLLGAREADEGGPDEEARRDVHDPAHVNPPQEVVAEHFVEQRGEDLAGRAFRSVR